MLERTLFRSLEETLTSPMLYIAVDEGSSKELYQTPECAEDPVRM